MNGVVNSLGLTRRSFSATPSRDTPCTDASSPGYADEPVWPAASHRGRKQFRWTKNVDCIVVGLAVTKPEAGNTGPAVFTVSGDGVPGGAKDYTLDELKALGETTGNYSYASKGNVITDECTGVLLADILASLGVTNPAWTIELLTTDGYEHETYIVDLQQVIDDAYLVTYEVNGSPVDPKGVDLLLFRHHDDGSTWFNKVKGFGGVAVTRFMQEIELPPPGTADKPAQVVIEVGEVTDFHLDLLALDADKYAIKMIVPIGVATPTLKLNTMEAGGGQLAVLPALTLECYLPIEGTGAAGAGGYPRRAQSYRLHGLGRCALFSGAEGNAIRCC